MRLFDNITTAKKYLYFKNILAILVKVDLKINYILSIRQRREKERKERRRVSDWWVNYGLLAFFLICCVFLW